MEPTGGTAFCCPNNTAEMSKRGLLTWNLPGEHRSVVLTTLLRGAFNMEPTGGGTAFCCHNNTSSPLSYVADWDTDCR